MSMDKIKGKLKGISDTVNEMILDDKSEKDKREIQSIKDKVLAITEGEGNNGLIGAQLAVSVLSFKEEKAVG